LKRSASHIGRGIVAVAAIPIVLLCVLELIARAATHTLSAWGQWPMSFVDPVLGRVPQPGLRLWDFANHRAPIGIGEYGTRLTGTASPRHERPLTVAVGDSFTFGEDVGDEDSWPAVLQRMSDTRVINGGVPGFGLDQTVLRAEQLAAVYSPETVIAAFIPDDVQRCEMSYHSGHAKPYFEIDASGLRYHPAPRPDRPLIKQLLSRSLVLDILLDKTLTWDGPSVESVHNRGKDVACLLMGRLAALGRERNTRVIVVAQLQAPAWSHEEVDLKNGVLACASANQLARSTFSSGPRSCPKPSARRCSPAAIKVT
jgi:hypothetical protein